MIDACAANAYESRIGERLLTADQYQRAIDRLGLSQVRAAMFLGVSLRTSQNWAGATTPVPEAVSMLLKLLIKYKIEPEALKKDLHKITIDEWKRADE